MNVRPPGFVGALVSGKQMDCLLLAVLLVTGCAMPGRGNAGCPNPSWPTHPTRVVAAPGVFEPHLVVGAGKVFAVGLRKPTWLRKPPWLDHDPRHTRTWVADVLAGTTLDLPVSDPPGAPEAVVDRASTLHVFWPELTVDPDVVPDFSSTRTRPVFRRVFHAAYAGGRWSAPQLVLDVDSAGWYSLNWGSEGNGSNLSAPLVDGTGAIHFFVIRRPGPDRMLFDIRSDSSRRTWTSGPVVDGRLMAVYVTATLGADGRIALAFVGPDPRAKADRNSVLFLGSADNGRTWSVPVLVSSSKTGDAYDPRIIAASDRLYIVWRKATDSGTTMWGVTSTDQGATWSQPVQIAPFVNITFNIVAAADGRGAHVLYPLLALDSVVPPRYLVNLGDGWSRPAPLRLPQLHRGQNFMMLANEGEGRLALGVLPFDESPGMAQRQLYYWSIPSECLAAIAADSGEQVRHVP